MDARRKTRASGSLRRRDTDCRAVTRDAFSFPEGDGKRDVCVFDGPRDADFATRRTRPGLDSFGRPLPSESDCDAAGWMGVKRNDFSSLVRVSIAVRLAFCIVVYLRQ
jgi:hypothetical protein